MSKVNGSQRSDREKTAAWGLELLEIAGSRSQAQVVDGVEDHFAPLVNPFQSSQNGAQLEGSDAARRGELTESRLTHLQQTPLAVIENEALGPAHTRVLSVLWV